MKIQSLDIRPLWLEIILTKGVLKREDIMELIEKFQIKFDDKKWKNTMPEKEMSNILISDVDVNKLFIAVNEILAKKYPNKLHFKNVKKIYLERQNDDLVDLAKFYLEISQNDKLKELVNRDILSNQPTNEFTKKEIWVFILAELYHVKMV